MKNNKFNAQNGQSLIEMMIVLTVVACITVMAILKFGNAQSNLNRQNIARELKINLERARFDSIKRRVSNTNEMATLIINSATSFQVAIDLNQNGVIENSDFRTVSFSNSNVRIVGNNLSFPITIRFDRRGFATTTNNLGMGISPNLTVCENCTLATANAQNSENMSISSTGTVLMTDGGETLPVFQNPDVSSVSGSSGINPTVTLAP